MHQIQDLTDNIQNKLRKNANNLTAYSMVGG
jgi:hypothetical protein